MNNPNHLYYNRQGRVNIQHPVQRVQYAPHQVYHQQQVYVQQHVQKVQPKQEPEVKDKKTTTIAINDAKLGRYVPSELDEAYENSLQQVVSALLYSIGFDDFERGALETLSTLCHSYIMKLGEQTRLACEISGRTIPTPSDTWWALINVGHNVEELPAYLDKVFNQKTCPVELPKTTDVAERPIIRKIGVPRPHPAYVYEWMPPLADPHTYIKTEISNEPDLSYEKMREAISEKKRNGQKSLVNYMIRSYPRLCLFSPFETIIMNTVKSAIEEESEKSRYEEAFKTFKQLVGHTDFDVIDGKMLYERGLISKEELDEGVEVACLCTDGSLIDVNGKRLAVADDLDVVVENTSEEKFVKLAGPKIPENVKVDKLMTEVEKVECFAGKDAVDGIVEVQKNYSLDFLPEWVYVLEPSTEHRSYLQSLLTDLKLEDEAKKEGKEETKTDQREEMDESVADNLYFRPPRVTRNRNSLSS